VRKSLVTWKASSAFPLLLLTLLACNEKAADSRCPATGCISQQSLAVKLSVLCIVAPLLDTDSARPGLQADCTVTETFQGTDSRRALPSCEASAPPCWRLDADFACQESGFRLAVDHGGCAPRRGTGLDILCATEPAR
jgi:hypothetical protein